MTLQAFGDLPAFHAARKPADALAIVYPEEQLTWSGFAAQVARRARLYRSLGVRQGDFVAVAIGNSIRFHEVIFAIWKLGATPGVIPAGLPPHELDRLIALVKPALIVGEASGTHIPTVTADADVTAFNGENFPSAVAPHWKAMSSGGSTGRPKLIVDTKPSAIDLDQPGLHDLFVMERDGVVLNPGPLYHNGPFLFTSLALFGGSTLIGLTRFDAEETLRQIATHEVGWVSLVPTMMHRISALPKAIRHRYDLSSLQALWHMAAPCPAWLKEEWIAWLGAERVWELYGGTEGFGVTRIRGDEWLAHKGSVGKIVEGSVKAVREDGSDCAPGEIGEIYMRLPDPSAPPSHYVGATPTVAGDGWRSIGDLGHVDACGYVYLADRRTDLILRGGANIYPAEIEAAIDAFPDAASSLVIGLPCAELGQRVHAIVEPRPGEAFDVGALHAFLSQRLPRYKLPQSYELRGAALRDEAGKARRSHLRDERIEWLAQDRSFQIFP